MKQVTDPSDPVYQEITLKRIARIAINKFLEFTQMVMKAIGVAA